MKNSVQLITYVDRLSGGGVKELRALLQGPLHGLFGGVHLLPFFHPIDGADAGFDPIDHASVDHRLGSWKDIQDLAGEVAVMADIIVNHVSSSSPQFLDVLARGSSSPYAEMFLTLERVFPEGASQADLLKIHSTRPSLPFTIYPLATGEKRLFWTSFTPQQIDIDVESRAGSAYLHHILNTFASAGVSVIRLDAGGYAIKRAGTSCFMLPETLEFIAGFTAAARAKNIRVLVEMHGHFEDQLRLAQQVDRVYDFCLPPLVLHALYQRDGLPLKRWLEVAPRNAFTVLDTHDGIGVADVEGDGRGRDGLLTHGQVRHLIEEIHRQSRGSSRLASGAAASNIDELQVNCSFYDALGGDDRAYLIARALQFFSPGIPQVYYVGLLAGRNDTELLSRTGVGRDINRHYYTLPEIDAELKRPVVVRLCELIRFRNDHPAFNGVFQVLTSPDDQIALRWSAGEHYAQLIVDLSSRTCEIHATHAGGRQVFSVLAGKP